LGEDGEMDRWKNENGKRKPVMFGNYSFGIFRIAQGDARRELLIS